MLDNSASCDAPPSSSDSPFALSENENGAANKRKRRPAGTPDPGAEVVSLSPKTLLESDRYVCEICNQGFQRDQNLQMHRRRHKVPWKLLKRETQGQKRRVFVCPESSCLHHDPCHALGDLVGIKKHFRRKHSNHKQWVCDKCSKGYAVQSDYKAHIKTCGTRGHSCDCGRVFSRVESFIEHQDACTVRQYRPELQALQPACSSRTASSTSPSSEANFSITPLQGLPLLKPVDQIHNKLSTTNNQHNLELQLLPSSINSQEKRNSKENFETHLKLSIGSCSNDKASESERPGSETNRSPPAAEMHVNDSTLEVASLKEFAGEELKLAMAENAYAEEARREAKRQIEIAELEFENAKRIRKQAQSELGKAEALRKQAIKKISSTVMEITCQSCKQQFQSSTAGVPSEETSIVMSYMSSATTEGEAE
ncbi:zinc finger protein SHOOT GRAVITROPISM 5 isoform X1 [Gastrolobium bilobum]|uniref:zinc finger protein SHOOT GRAVITROPISM 5 isoform X1 n=1 Tax=Gastrolobium bilobum TaxID=150636 RepID=UPI002AB2A8B4|nr:zinc finger protein SHOOT GRAVITROPISM 5 isoform X1 [Gastrolobium bilobum]